MADDTLNIIIKQKSTGTGAKDAKKDVGGLEKAAKLAAGAFAAMKAAQGAIDFVKFGADVGRQSQALDNLAASAGTSGDAIVTAMQSASDFTIDRMGAMEAANKALLMGVATTPDEFERMTRVATALGRAMGQDATKSIDDFVVAAARQSRQIADNLGLVVSIEDSTKKYAQQLGKTSDQLTDAEKKQAFLNAMLEAGEEKLGALGETGGDAATNIEVLTAGISDAKAGLAEMAAEAVNSLIPLDDLGARFRGLPETVKQLGILAEGAVAAVEAFVGGEDAVDAFNESVREGVGAVTEYSTASDMAIDGWATTVEVMTDADVAARDLAVRMNAIAQAEKDWTDAATAQDYVDNLANLGLQAEKGMEKLADGIVEVQTATENAATPVDEWQAALEAAAESAQNAALAQMDLSQRLAEATEAQIAQAAISQLGQALEEGEISFEDYQMAVTETQLAFGLATPESIALASNITALTGALGDGTIGAGDYNEALDALIGQAQAGSTNINLMADALNALPKEVTIDVIINQIGSRDILPAPGADRRQHGSPYFPGGMAWVGEGGPELVRLPRGSRIFSAPQSQQIVNNNQRYNLTVPQGGVRQEIGSLMDIAGRM